MTGIFSLTDWHWFQFLSAEQDLDEVNFWRPSDRNSPSWAPGTPVIFKLKQAHGGRIVGYGTFTTHSLQPAWAAWDVLGHRNGAASFVEFHAMLASIRGGKGIYSDSAGNFEIGCIMLSAPVFLPRELWIAPPADWPPSGIMQGKSYELNEGEGARVWQQLLAVTPHAEGLVVPTSAVAEPTTARYGSPVLSAPRLGQGAFRFAVSDAYGRACAVTREHSRPVLEAAHIKPYAESGPHSVANGIFLRSDIHRLFDKGYVTVSPEDRRFVVGWRLKDDYENGKTYYALHGTALHEPVAAIDRPDREFLDWHARERFRG
jgi:putative restriction endonuclease